MTPKQTAGLVGAGLVFAGGLVLTVTGANDVLAASLIASSLAVLIPSPLAGLVDGK